MDVLLMKVPEAAAALGVSRAKLYELIACGALPAVKVDGCSRVRTEDLVSYVNRLSPTNSTGDQVAPVDRGEPTRGLRLGYGRMRPPRRTGLTSTMATDYDASRKSEEEQKEDSLEALRPAATDKDTNSGKIDEDETEAAESFELPGADLSNEELSVEVVPKQDDEFTCSGASSCTTAAHEYRRVRLSVATARKGVVEGQGLDHGRP